MIHVNDYVFVSFQFFHPPVSIPLWHQLSVVHPVTTSFFTTGAKIDNNVYSRVLVFELPTTPNSPQVN